MATLNMIKHQFFDANGNYLTGGKVYTYEGGTTTPKASYTTSVGDVANANPIILNSRGEASIWMSGIYKIRLTDSLDNEIYTVDMVSAEADSADITFLQSGTGAVVTTIQSKARESVSLKDFGGKADGGVTDNSGPFALAATRAGAGGRVYVPAGDNFYGFATGLTITLANLTIEGDGDRTMLVNTNAAGQNLFTVDGVRGVRFKNFSMAGHASSGHGIELINGSHHGYTENIFCRNMGLDVFRSTNGFGWTHINPRFSTNIYASSVIGPFPYASASAVAENGIKCVNGATTGTQTIIGPLIEGMGTAGIYLNAENSTVLGGTVEGNGTVNIDLIGNQMKVYGTNAEAPGTGPSIRIAGNLNVIDGVLSGGATADLQVVSGVGNSIMASQFNVITIDSGAVYTKLHDVWYGSNSGAFTDNGQNTIIDNLINTANANHVAAGKKRDSHINYARNGGFERWLSASSLDAAPYGGWAPFGSPTIVRTGDGEADTTKHALLDSVYTGHYAIKVTASGATEGIQYQGPIPPCRPADAGSGLRGDPITASVWAKTGSGTAALNIRANYGGAIDSKQFTVTTTWTKFSYTFNKRTSAFLSNYPYIDLIVEDTKTIYFDDFVMTAGEAESFSDWDNIKVREPEPIGHHTLTSSATPTIYGDLATFQTMTLTSNVTGVTLANPVYGQPLRIKFTQGGAGAYTVAWTTTVNWIAATPPTITVAVGASDIIELMHDGIEWYCTNLIQNVR